MRYRIYQIAPVAIGLLLAISGPAAGQAMDSRLESGRSLRNARVATSTQVVADTLFLGATIPVGSAGMQIPSEARYVYITQVAHYCPQATITSGNQDCEIKQGANRYGSVAVPSTAPNLLTFDPPLRYELGGGNVILTWTSNWSTGTHRLWWHGYWSRR